MIKHHPKKELLQLFVTGELPASLSAAIAIHTDMCPSCQQKTAQMMNMKAGKIFDDMNVQSVVVDDEVSESNIVSLNFEDMIASIVADEQQTAIPVHQQKNITIGEQSYTLPRAIENMTLGRFTQMGKISRARLQLDEGEIHSSLLNIDPGGSVPEHTHKGYELTLLLDGQFTDEQGCYVPGDFIMRDATDTHQPYSEKGCLCFTVANDSLHFTKGINRLLNPIGSFIY